MKSKFTLACLLGTTLVTVATTDAATLLAWDFSGATNTSASDTAIATTVLEGMSASTMTRGAGVGSNNAANSFRGTGFSNDGIATTNTDYFQFTVAAESGFTLSLTSLTVNVNGTGTFMNSPGVTFNFGYSLDGGTTFTLLSTPVTRTSAGTGTFDVSGVSALQDIESAIFRFYASGQTTTGGFGLQSAASAGTNGLVVEGTLIPEPSTALIGALGFLGILRRRR